MKNRVILTTLATAALVAGGLTLVGCKRSTGNSGGQGVSEAEQPKNPEGQPITPSGSGAAGNQGMPIDG